MQSAVFSSLCPLHTAPDASAPLADELLCGWPVEILSAAGPSWAYVRTHYRYEGYAPTCCLTVRPEEEEAWRAQRKALILQPAADVLKHPAVSAPRVCTLLRGSLVAPEGEPQEGWQKILLPHGVCGYTKCSFLGPYPTTPRWDGLRRRVVEAATAYRGVQYRWGGKSPLGIDCSGLVFMAYFLNGLLLYRDAKIVPGFPVRPIPLSQAQPADLLFFPGHVALCLEGGRYLHATARAGSDGVVINSLRLEDPLFRTDLAQSLQTAGTVFPLET